MTAFYVYWIHSATRCYIGATVNPSRRLRQHNGELVGGARRTRNRGPWSFVRVISGFRTWREALQFEWAFKFYTKRCRCTASRQAALQRLMATDRWTSNAPPASEVPLAVEFNPTQYGMPPVQYEADRYTKETHRRTRHQRGRGGWRKRLYGVTE